MQAVDWNASATLIERDDSGSDLHYHFRTLEKSTLGELVRKVAEMSADDRARLVIDSGGGTINVGEIMTLAQRDDLP